VATRLNAQPNALAAWTRAIAELKRSTFVLAIGRCCYGCRDDFIDDYEDISGHQDLALMYFPSPSLSPQAR